MEKEKTVIIPDIYNLEFIKNRAETIIKEFAQDPENGIKDFLAVNINNQVFNAVLSDIRLSLFFGVDPVSDPLLLIIIFDAFIYLNTKYNKIVSVESFSFFSGVSLDLVNSWSQDANTITKNDILDNHINELYFIYNKYIFNKYSDKQTNNNNTIYYINLNNIILPSEVLEKIGKEATAVKGHIFNKIAFFRESAIKNKFFGAKQLLGAVAVVNREFGWSAERIGKEERARALTLSDLPKLTDYVNPQKTIESDETPKTPIL